MTSAQFKLTGISKNGLSNSDLDTNKLQQLGYCSHHLRKLSQKVQPTFAAVERLFSMLSKLQRKDRNF